MAKTRRYNRRKSSFRKKGSIRKRNSKNRGGKRKRRTKHKRKHGGYQEVELYRKGFNLLNEAISPEEVKNACTEIQRSLGKKYTSVGCAINFSSDDRDNCRREKQEVLTKINNKLRTKLNIYSPAVSIGSSNTSLSEEEQNRVAILVPQMREAIPVISKTIGLIDDKISSKY